MILVTGGAGFIGSNIAARFTGAGTDTAVCDWLGNDDKWKNLRHHLLADIVAPENLDAWLEVHGRNLSSIIHMGAISSTTESDVDLIIDSNFRLSVKLWQFCSASQIPFIYASSAATYGDGDKGFDDNTEDEYMAGLMPLNPYGWSKHLFDRWVLSQLKKGNPQPPKWAGLKFFNVYGPNEYHKGSMKSVIAQNYDKVASGEAIRLFKSYNPDHSDGGQMRDFVYVKDCVNVIEWMLNHEFEPGIYNLGTGLAKSWNDLARAMFAAIGRPANIDYIEMPETLRGRYQYFTEATMAKLKRAGCNINFRSLDDGVKDYITAHLSQEDPYL